LPIVVATTEPRLITPGEGGKNNLGKETHQWAASIRSFWLAILGPIPS